jgi:hypothetical protein
MTFPTHRPLVRRWAGATAIVLASTLALAGCSGSDDPVPASGDSREPASTSPKPRKDASPSSTESPSETPSETSSASAGATVPVYYVGDGPGGKPRLFREFHRVSGDPLVEAARLVAGGGEPDDPDYRTLWPQVEVSGVTATDGVLLVDIPGDGFTERPDGMSKRMARLAMQQMVYTLQGVQQERVPVRVERGGSDLFGLPSDVPYSAVSALRTLNLVSITSPAEGDTVTGDTLTVTGVANSFEASGPCRLIASDEEVALVPYQAEGWMEDRLFPFEVEIPLADAGTGDVLVQCETDDPSGGAEGDGPSVDTKLITVQ